MNRVQKTEHVRYYENVLKDAQSMVFVEFAGLKVEEINKIRREFRAANCEYKVIKNTLLEHASQGTAAQVIKPTLAGPLAILFSREDPAAPARIALKIAKEYDKFKVHSGYIDGQLLDKSGVTQLSSMPSKQELRAMLLATFIAAPQKMLRLLQAAPSRMLMVLDARKRSLESANNNEG
ncbi:50S ribosomal protein L10 [Myxococcota bacterium]|nr:50S ribosomal protein L10 [Myxococcota bacterium]